MFHEQVTVEVSGKRKLHTKLIRVQKAAENRVSPKCPVFYLCGGYPQHPSYDGQLEYKQQSVERLMKEHIDAGAKFYQILGMQEPALPQQEPFDLQHERKASDYLRNL